jgi:hypothetical protein
MRVFGVISVAALLASGCMAPSPRQQQIEALKIEARENAPVCSAPTQCARMWEAAQLFVVQNAGYKLQVATDVVIETYNAMNSSTALAMRVVKTPVSGGYRFEHTAWCANIFGCEKEPVASTLAFNRALRDISE